MHEPENAGRPALLRYRLIDPRGNDLGPYVSRSADWQPGKRISLGGGEEYVVVGVVEPEVEDFRAYLVVERVGTGAPPVGGA